MGSVVTIPTNDSAPPRGHAAPYVVAVLDILGFRQELKKPNGLLRVHAWHDELRDLARANDTTLHWSPGAAAKVQTRHLSISDGLYLWSDTTKGRAGGFVVTVSAVVAGATRARIPLRGAIAAGEGVIDPRTLTFIGQPLVDAVEAEKYQEWLGVAVLPSAAPVVGIGDRVVPYAVPTKRRPAKSTFRRLLGCTDPGPQIAQAVAWHQEMQQDEALGALAALERDAPEPSRRKYENARRFVEAFPLDGASA